jgi:hypothetical protein
VKAAQIRAAALNVLWSLLKISSCSPRALIMPNGWFRPGDQVPTTGIYTANHDGHRSAHEVFATEGDKFPNCRVCGERVNFALAQAASHIHKDDGFGKAAGSKAPKKRKKSSSADG